MEGWLYVLVNSHMRGLVKIGRTDRPPSERADEISSVTGVPSPFILIWQEQVSNSVVAEREVHQLLGADRLTPDREFFRIDPQSAIEAVTSVASRFSPTASPVAVVQNDWEREDEKFIQALALAQSEGEIDPRKIRMKLSVSFEESRAIFDKLKMLGSVDQAGRLRR